MNHLFTRALWSPDTDLLYTELEDLDAKTVDSLSATGGTYALTDYLIIGGAPGLSIQFDVPLNVAGASVHGVLSVDDSTYLSATLDVGGDATFAGTNFNLNSPFMNFGDSSADLFTFNAHGTFEAGVNFNDGVFFNDSATFNSGATFNDFLNADGNCFLGSVAGFVEFLGAVTSRVPISFADAGKVKWRNKTLTVTGNQSVVAAQVDTVFVPNGLMGAGNIVTIDDTGAEDGMRIEFATTEVTNVVAITTPAALTTPIKNAAAAFQTVAYQRIAGVWQVVSLGRVS